MRWTSRANGIDTPTSAKPILHRDRSWRHVRKRPGVRKSATSRAGSRSVDELSKPDGDVIERKSCLGNLHHQRVAVIIGGRSNTDVIDLEEDPGREPAEAVVAVDKGVVSHDGLRKRGSLEPDRRIGIFAADGGLWRCDGRGQQANARIGGESPSRIRARSSRTSRSTNSTGRSAAESLDRVGVHVGDQFSRGGDFLTAGSRTGLKLLWRRDYRPRDNGRTRSRAAGDDW